MDILQQFGILTCQLSNTTITSTTTAIRATTDRSNGCSSNDQQSSSSSLWYQWCMEEAEIYGWEGKLAAIIILDQFSRHIHRSRLQQQQQWSSSSSTSVLSPNQWEYIQQHLPTQNELDQLAYTTTQLLLQHHSIEFHSTSMISIPMRIFAIMPLRHQCTIPSVQQTQHYIDTLFTQQQQSCCTMIQSFRKATNRRLAVLQDEARRTGAGTTGSITTEIVDTTADTVTELVESHHPQHQSCSDNDQQQLEFTEDDILECGYFVPENPDTVPIHHIVYETIRNFLDQYVIPAVGSCSTGSSNDVNSHKRKNNNNSASLTNLTPTATEPSLQSPTTTTQQQHRQPIIVSLSGGVDSMVICAVLAHLQQYNPNYQQHIQIVAVHIDYGNRPESYAEAMYVQQYCRSILGNVHYYCRRIDEVTRGITARDTYERIARDIRYQFYRDIINKYTATKQVNNNIENSSNNNNGEPKIEKNHGTSSATERNTIGIMLGHHRGDLRENVLSNSHKGCGPLDLSGMTSISNNDGVVLFRPLLPLEKTLIFDYAHKFGIPYFKDTTPHWSTRGKLRNKLLPLLEEIYGEGSMNNLSNLAVESDECRTLLHKVMIQPFLDGIIYQPMGISFATFKWINQGPYFWKIVLREALHSAGLGMLSDKSVESFMKRVCCANIHEGWLQCRKDFGVYLRADGFVFVLYPVSFPWGNPTSIKTVIGNWTKDHPNVVCADEETVVQVGPWTVTTRRHKCNSGGGHEMIERKVFTAMESFMDGVYEYWLEAPPLIGLLNSTNPNINHNSPNATRSQQLIFTSFVKSTRPKAWKGIDPKIQDALPLLGYATTKENHSPNEIKKHIGKECSLARGVDLISLGNDEINDAVSVEKVYAMVRLSLTEAKR